MTQFYLSCVLSFLLAGTSLTGSLKAQQVIFSDDFENGSFRPEWELQVGQPNGVIEVTPEVSLQGKYAARLGKSTDNAHTLNRLDLKLDLSLPQQVFLNLLIYNNHEETHVQDGIFLSTDGGSNFEKIFDFKFEDWVEKRPGSLPPINISALARKKGMTLSTRTVIRFQQYGKDDFTGSEDFSDGIYLDQVTLTALDFPNARLPYSEDFASGTLQAPLMTGDPSLSDSSGVLSNAPLLEVGSFTEDSLRGPVLRMGSRYDKSPATNALDLYLDLKNESNVKLVFDFYDNRDETSPADGLFFSDDGGYTFTKVLGFDTDNWSDDYFGRFPPLNVDQLARQHGIQLNERFVIRIQQHGTEDFEGSRLSSDGIMIDNIRVFSVEPVYASLPFTETFDGPRLAPYWQVNAPYYPDMPTSISPSANVELVQLEDSSRVVRLGNTTDRCYTTNALDLYVQLAKHPEATLSFRFMDHFDETHIQDGIFFSEDGGRSFKKVFSFNTEEWSDKEFGKFSSLSIAQLANANGLRLTDTFVIRFQQHDNDDFEGTRTISDGIYLDDITISEPEPGIATVSFRETFENDSLAGHWYFGNPMLTARVENLKPGGIVMLQDSVGRGKSRGLAMGRLSDGKLTTNLLDLQLSLQREKDLQLIFWMHNNYNDLDQEDGIWLSKDGGRSFKKAWSYPDTPGISDLYVLDFDSLVFQAGLRYTEAFVLRFQQSDDRRLNGRGNMRGGIYLDDITLTHALKKPVIVWPPDSALITDCREYPIYWDEVDHSTAYRAQLYAVHEEREVIIKDTTLSLNRVNFTELEEDSVYHCRVQALSDYTSSSWSSPISFRTHPIFEAAIQIVGEAREDSTLVLQASQLPAHEYLWYRNGVKLTSTGEPLLKVKEPGNYSVFITNQHCGIMSPVLEVSAEALGLEESSRKREQSAQNGYGPE